MSKYYELSEQADSILYAPYILLAPDYQRENMQPALRFFINPKMLGKALQLAMVYVSGLKAHSFNLFEAVNKLQFENVPNEVFVKTLALEKANTEMLNGIMAELNWALDEVVSYIGDPERFSDSPIEVSKKAPAHHNIEPAPRS